MNDDLSEYEAHTPQPLVSLDFGWYIYIHIYIDIHTYIYIYIHT